MRVHVFCGLGCTLPGLPKSNLSLGFWFPWQHREEQPSNQAVMLKKILKRHVAWEPSDCHSYVYAQLRDSFM